MKLYLVEVESGSSEQGNAMVFDSVWSSLELAEKHCKKFEYTSLMNQGTLYEITEIEIDKLL